MPPYVKKYTLLYLLVLFPALSQAGPYVYLSNNSIAIFKRINTKIERETCYKYMLKTNQAVFAAKIALEKRKNFTGDLKNAVLHQRQAKWHYDHGAYDKALAHSQIARKSAQNAIKANKQNPPEEAKFSQEEEKLLSDINFEETILDEEMRSRQKSAISERALLKMSFQLDIEE